MSLNYYKSETEKVCKSKGWDRAAVDTVWLLLTEEVGELAQAVRKGSKEEQLHELGDVLAWLASLANQLDLSLDDAINRYVTNPP